MSYKFLEIKRLICYSQKAYVKIYPHMPKKLKDYLHSLLQYFPKFANTSETFNNLQMAWYQGSYWDVY